MYLVLEQTGNKNPPREVVDELIKLYQEGLLSEVSEKVDNLLDEFEGSFVLSNIKGAVSLSNGKFLDAEFEFKRSIELNPRDPNARNNLGIALQKQGRVDEAILEFGRALEINSNYPEALNNLGHAQMYTMGTLLKYGSEVQKSRWLPLIAKGDIRLQAFGVTEPEAGTDTTSISTAAIRKGDKYILNGQKIWTSRALQSDLMVLLAKTKPKNERCSRSDGLSLFLVDIRESIGKGMTIKPIETMVNHSTTEVFFENLEIPCDNLIGKENEGFKQILNSMNAERILIAAECIGDSDWFINKAVDYAKDRKVFNKKIGANQGIQFPISRCYAETEGARLAVYNAAKIYDTGKDCGTEANIAKLLAADASWNSANMCLQTHGGFGFAKEYHIERKFRETRLYQVAPISTNFILSYIGEHKLGLPRSF